ncbi:MAG: hypothetical protein KIT17_20390 [Rubrivivax sp.]|nr:hypothetical protein [Rubrivivax sp.]
MTSQEKLLKSTEALVRDVLTKDLHQQRVPASTVSEVAARVVRVVPQAPEQKPKQGK